MVEKEPPYIDRMMQNSTANSARLPVSPAHGAAEGAHAAVDGSDESCEPDAAREPEDPRDAEDAQSRKQQRNGGEPVALQEANLFRRNEEAQRELDDEHDPDGIADRLEQRRDAARQLEDEQREPDDAEHEHRRVEPPLDAELDGAAVAGGAGHAHRKRKGSLRFGALRAPTVGMTNTRALRDIEP